MGEGWLCLLLRRYGGLLGRDGEVGGLLFCYSGAPGLLLDRRLRCKIFSLLVGEAGLKLST